MTPGLTSARVLKRSVAWNALGTVLPLVMAVVAVPLLINGLGQDRFGLLTIVWALVGYASLFDLGLGRALTLVVAARLGRMNVADTDAADQTGGDLNALVWTALWLLLALGVLGALVLWALAPSLVAWIRTPEGLAAEAVTAFRVLAFGLPLVFVTSGLTGVLVALQRFDVITAIRLPLSLVTTLGPVLTLLVSPSLVWISALMLGARVLSVAVFAWQLGRLRPDLVPPTQPRRGLTRHLIGHGGWMTVTNVVGPLLSYLDRFFVGSVLGTAAVAWYVTPHEVLSKLIVIPGILLSVLFPALATAYASDPVRAASLYKDAAVVLRHAMLPVCVLFLLFADELLTLWIHADFAANAAPVARWLAVGVWINILAHTPFAFLQGAGRADLSAKAHMAELLPYLAVLLWWTHAHGVAGAAAAWTARALVDTLALNWLAARVHAPLAPQVRREMLAMAAGLAVCAVCALLGPLWMRLTALLIISAHAGWHLRPYARRLLPTGATADAK